MNSIRSAIPIVCETLIAGMEDSVVGVVRIDEREDECVVRIAVGRGRRFSERQKNQSRRGIQKSPAGLSRTWRVRSRTHLQGSIDRPRAGLPGISGHGAVSKCKVLSTPALGAARRTGALWFAPCENARRSRLLSTRRVRLLGVNEQ